MRPLFRCVPFFEKCTSVEFTVTRFAWWYNRGHTSGMKTAISIPDEVFEAADRAARKLGMSRSELYATAVHEFIERHRIEDVTSKLDEVYASARSDVDGQLSRMQSLILTNENW